MQILQPQDSRHLEINIQRRFALAILITGFGGLVAQVLLLRELLIVFSGNELSLGIILANWLILEAFGAFVLGKRIEQIKGKIEAFVGFQIIFSLSLPAAVYLTRILRSIIGLTPGEGLGFVPMLISSFFILLPVSITHGGLFTFGCKIHSLYSEKEDVISIGRVYAYEILGTMAGGIILNYLLIPYLHSLQIALGLALLNFTLCIILLYPFWPHGQKLGTRILGSLSTLLLFSTGILIFSGQAERIHWLSIKNQWRNQDVVHYQNSKYGNIVVIKAGEGYTLFSNGTPIITTPTPDIVSVEEFVHLSMLSHPDPEEILIITGGAGGVINEILKYPVERIDYAELDPLILEVVKRFPTVLTETELNDPRVRIKYIDGRLFVKTTPHQYDLVLIGLSCPSDLQVNRLFTEEFFLLVEKILKYDGILVIGLPGSLTYLNKELKDLNACIINTLKKVYPYLKMIPGESMNLYLASTSEYLPLITHTQLSQRLRERRPDVNLISPEYLEYRLHPRWLDWFLNSLKGSTTKINQDFKPIGVFFGLSYWHALFSPYILGLFRWFERINLGFIALFLFLIIMTLLILSSKIKRLSHLGIPLSITTTGFAGMVLSLALIFTFQTLYGYVFYWLGLLVTAFMLGAGVGGMVMTMLLARIKRDLATFIKIELVILLFSALLPLIFLHPYLDVSLPLKISFLILSFSAGLLVGGEFPLANRLYMGYSPDLSRTAGLLYGVDLFGGWLGGILGGVVLLPVLGLFQTCMVVVMLKACSLIILAISDRRLV